LNANSRKVSARKLLNVVSHACETETSDPLIQFFNQYAYRSDRRPDAQSNLPDPLLELECLGETLTPVVTNLESGKFLWQMLAEVRAALVSGLTMATAAHPGESGQDEINVKDERPGEPTERELNLFFELSLDLLCIATTDGYFKRLNPAFAATLGWSLAELMANPFLEFVHPDDVAATMAEIERLAQGEPTIHFKNRYHCLDGTYKWLAWTAQPSPDGLIYAVARDVTTRNEIEQSLHETQVHLAEARRIARLGTWRWDIETNQLSWSDELYELFGLDQDQVMTFEAYTELIHPDDRDWTLGVIQEILESGTTSYEVEHRLIDSDGQLRYIVASGSILRTQEGQAHRIIGIVQDITERKQTEDNLSQALTEVETLYDVNTRLNAAKNVQAVVDAIAAPMLVNGAAGAALVLFDPAYSDHSEWAEVVAALEPRQQTMPVGTRYDLAEFPLTGLGQLDSDMPIMIGSVATDEQLDASARTFLDRIEAAAVVILPLKQNEIRFGEIIVRWTTPQTFTAADQRLYVSIVLQTSVAVNNLLLLDQTYHRVRFERDIRDITDKLRAAPNLDRLLETAARELGQRLGVRHTVLELGIEPNTPPATHGNGQ
jgi:PAS domain S-box-containing protein